MAEAINPAKRPWWLRAPCWLGGQFLAILAILTAGIVYHEQLQDQKITAAIQLSNANFSGDVAAPRCQRWFPAG